MSERNIYLTNRNIEDVLSEFLEMLDVEQVVKPTTIDIRNAIGYVTNSPVYARLSSPSFNAAAMDGIAVVSEKTYKASEANAVTLALDTDFVYVNTGNPIQPPYDSVIMIEDVYPVDETHVKIIEPSSPWQHVRPVGEDIVAGEMILPENHTIRPMDIGAVLSGGVVSVSVYEKINVAIIPTGSEIIDNYEAAQKGKIFDTNSWTFKGLVEQLGATCNRLSPVDDNLEKLLQTVLEMAEKNHVVVINAGSSAGTKDFTAQVIENLGQVFVHGIAIKPGKPTILGLINGKPVIGLPGYPGSAYLVFEEIVSPIIKLLQKKPVTNETCVGTVKAVVSKRIVSSLKYKEYIRVKLGKVHDRLVATPLNRGAGVTMAIVRSDGVLVVPKNSEGFEAGEEVDVVLTNPIDKIDKTIVSIGSHDLIMDIIGSIMQKKHGFGVSSAHVGSMGGIMSLKRKEAHIAPIHLLDEQTGEYNAAYIERYLKNDDDVVLIKGVKRTQGFIVKKGNPKGISSIEDLARADITFVNRQKGSGTRILTDYLLKKASVVSPDKIIGYKNEMTTHMAVAAAVEGGMADCGVGVYSAAHVMGLDFVAIGDEEYDFAIPKAIIDTPMIKAFLAVLSSDEFKNELERLGGYGVHEGNL